MGSTDVVAVAMEEFGVVNVRLWLGQGFNGQSFGCGGDSRVIVYHNLALEGKAVTDKVLSIASKFVAVTAERLVVTAKVAVSWIRY